MPYCLSVAEAGGWVVYRSLTDKNLKVSTPYSRNDVQESFPSGRVPTTTDKQFWYVIAYIHQNPQKHGFVKDEFPPLTCRCFFGLLRLCSGCPPRNDIRNRKEFFKSILFPVTL